MEYKGTGRMQPKDAEEAAEITVTVEDGVITGAEFLCAGDDLFFECVRTVCEVIKDKPYNDVMQMNNNAVYYNTVNELPRDRLYLASIAVMTAKKAVKDCAVKNGLPIDVPDDGCNCI